MNATSPVLCLSDILLSKARTRSVLSSRLAISICVAIFLMVGVIIWSAVYLNKVSSGSLYGVLAVFVIIWISSIAYCSVTIARGSGLTDNLSRARSWHKTAYRLLAGLAIVEHCVFFTCIPIMLYHSLGLSMSVCLTSASCEGLEYERWNTVSVTDGKMRIQELSMEPVTAYLTVDRLAVFGGLLASLTLSIISLVLYIVGESLRHQPPQNGKSRSSLSLFRRRRLFVRLMGTFTLTQLLFGILGISLIGNNWFAACIVLSLVSLYPVFKLHQGLTKDPTITRFQFRKTSQTCISLVFLWLYCSGSGISATLVSGIDLPASSIFEIAGSVAMAQIILILAFHLIFSIISASALYVHLSVTDVIASLIKTQGSPHIAELPAVVRINNKSETLEAEETAEAEQPDPSPPISWESRQCASCNTHQPNSVLVPCGHSVICSDCSNVLLTIPGFRCPLCCAEVIDSHIVANP